MVSVYYLSIDPLRDGAVLSAVMDRLSPGRRSRAEGIGIPDARLRSVAAGFLLETALDEAGIAGAERRIAVEESGRPYLAARPDISFNLSHSGEYAMCAITSAHDVPMSSHASHGTDAMVPRPIRIDLQLDIYGACSVGCDIERIAEEGRGADRLKIAERFFADNEKRLVREAGTEEEKRLMFTRLWTLKESFVKALGKGFGIPFGSFGIGFDGKGCACPEYGAGGCDNLPDPGSIRFEELRGPEGYCSSLCLLTGRL